MKKIKLNQIQITIRTKTYDNDYSFSNSIKKQKLNSYLKYLTIGLIKSKDMNEMFENDIRVINQSFLFYREFKDITWIIEEKRKRKISNEKISKDIEEKYIGKNKYYQLEAKNETKKMLTNNSRISQYKDTLIGLSVVFEIKETNRLSIYDFEYFTLSKFKTHFPKFDERKLEIFSSVEFEKETKIKELYSIYNENHEMFNKISKLDNEKEKLLKNYNKKIKEIEDMKEKIENLESKLKSIKIDNEDYKRFSKFDNNISKTKTETNMLFNVFCGRILSEFRKDRYQSDNVIMEILNSLFIMIKPNDEFLNFLKREKFDISKLEY